jgi:flavin reductase (DIM6/NTAB) family NADH-FMN oxidoreductase RutF
VPLDPDTFRDALAGWASGVTIVTSRRGDRIHGMTVSAFSSVSLDPPLILVCAEKSSITNSLIEQSRVFCVNVLAADQDALSNKFASKRDEHRRFEGLECQNGATDCPRIPGAAVQLDCRVVESVDAGDHYVYIGSVEHVVITDAEPLVYHRGAYRGLA